MGYERKHKKLCKKRKLTSFAKKRKICRNRKQSPNTEVKNAEAKIEKRKKIKIKK